MSADMDSRVRTALTRRQTDQIITLTQELDELRAEVARLQLEIERHQCAVPRPRKARSL